MTQYSKQNLRQLIMYRIGVDLKSELWNSWLGWLWWILEPIMYLGAFYLVFDVIFQRGGPGFVGFLLCGLVFWRWFDSSIKRAAGSIFANTQLIQQVAIPKIVFPLTELGASFCRFLFVLALFMVFLILYKGGLSLSVLYLPILLLTQASITLGLAMLLASVVPFAPDIRKLLDHAMMLMFYMSGIFFSISQVPEHLQAVLYLNPMAVLIEQYRLVLLDGEAPDLVVVSLVFGIGIALTFAGTAILRRFDSAYASQLS